MFVIMTGTIKQAIAWLLLMPFVMGSMPIAMPVSIARMPSMPSKAKPMKKRKTSMQLQKWQYLMWLSAWMNFFAIKSVAIVAMPVTKSAAPKNVDAVSDVGRSVAIDAIAPLRALCMVVKVMSETMKSAVPMLPRSVV